MNICTVSNLRTLIILSRYAKRNGKLSMAALRCSLGGTQTQDFMFPWLRMASVSVLHFMTYLGTKTDLTQYVHIFKFPSSSYVSKNYKFYTDSNIFSQLHTGSNLFSLGTDKSLSEVLILASTNPQYDDRLSIKLRVLCM